MDTPLHIVSRYALRTHIFFLTAFGVMLNANFMKFDPLFSSYKVWLARDRRKAAQEEKYQNDELTE